jgi:C1A family cysteine protease
MTMKVRDLKKILADTGATWTVDPMLNDDDDLPRLPTGGATPPRPSPGIPKTPLRRLLARRTNNPRLLRRRIARGLISPEEAERISIPTPETDEVGGTGSDDVTATTRPTLVDWRNRWGYPWITSVRTQSPCNSCWAFSSIALIESIARIENNVWCWRSEGDLLGSLVGFDCDSSGDPDLALLWIEGNDIADPGCYSWEQEKSDSAYKPTSDRAGRSTKVPNYDWLWLDDAELKDYLDQVGPVLTRFLVYSDFQACGAGVYHHVPLPDDDEYVGHYMLLVGYDDSRKCWIVKNSWGANKGDKGYYYIAYGEPAFDDAWIYRWGLQIADPDPWTRRRQHGGNIIETIENVSGDRMDRFIMLQTVGTQIRHWWRENWVSGLPWKQGPLFANDAASFPMLTATTFGSGNYECIYLTTAKRLHHWVYTQESRTWGDAKAFGPTDAAGAPGFLQSSYSAPGNFELVVRTSDSKLCFWYRMNKSPWTWTEGGRFASDVAYSGPTLVQHSNGNLELVCVLNDGRMQHWYRDTVSGPWKILSTFGSAVKSSPCMIIGQTGAASEKVIGNYELCVAVSGKIEHWYRDLAQNMDPWVKGTTFAHDVTQVVGMLQGSFFFGIELIVLRTDKKVQHYWKDAKGWHEGVVIG